MIVWTTNSSVSSFLLLFNLVFSLFIAAFGICSILTFMRQKKYACWEALGRPENAKRLTKALRNANKTSKRNTSADIVGTWLWHDSFVMSDLGVHHKVQIDALRVVNISKSQLLPFFTGLVSLDFAPHRCLVDMLHLWRYVRSHRRRVAVL